MKIKTYSELITYQTFEERYRYLRLEGIVGADTFGFDRIFNQQFYTSTEWKRIRDIVIARDNGCDLGVRGHEIFGKIIIHHINPISLDDLDRHSDMLLNPEYLITTMHTTHNAIHYGDEGLLITAPIERSKNDTCPWKRQ
jgi:hypothetical protein